MSSKRKHRRRPPDGPAGTPVGTGRKRGLGPLGLWLMLVAGFSVVGLGGWRIVGSWKRAETVPIANQPLKAASRTKQDLVERVKRGNELLSAGKVAEAVQALTEAALRNPGNEDVHYNLALALTREGDDKAAIQEYEIALKILPNYVEAHNNLGNLLMRAGRVEEAIPHFEQAVKIMPDYAAAHNNLGTALQKAGRANDALDQFQLAVKYNPEYWQAHFNVGTSCLQRGRLIEARTEFDTVLHLHPDFEPAKRLLARIQAQSEPGGSQQ